MVYNCSEIKFTPEATNNPCFFISLEVRFYVSYMLKYHKYTA